MTNDTYAYDAENRMFGAPQTTYTYDAENRIVSVGGATSATYTYDADGRRINKTVGSTGINYLYDLAGHPVMELNASNGSWNRGEVFTPSGMHLGTYIGRQTYFAYTNWLGTERMRTDQNGTIQQYCDWTISGEYISCGTYYTFQTPTGLSTRNFAGYEHDAETGLEHTTYRYYNAHIGRWMGVDPLAGSIGNPQSLNRYSYSWNDPVDMTDSSGLWPYDFQRTCGTIEGIGVPCSVFRTVQGMGATANCPNNDCFLLSHRQDGLWIKSDGGDTHFGYMASSTRYESIHIFGTVIGKGSGDSWWSMFGSDLLNHWSFQVIRKDGESVSKCVDRAQQGLLGKSGAVALNAAVPISGAVSFYTAQTGTVTLPSAAVSAQELAKYARGVESTIKVSSLEWEFISTGQLADASVAARAAGSINGVAAPLFAVLVGVKLGFYGACTF